MSVPDSEMLLSISEVLETPVSTLLGETTPQPEMDDLKTISEKLEVINLQLAQRKAAKRRLLFWLFVTISAVIVVISFVLKGLGSPYMSWNYNDPETAIIATVFHSFEWLFYRVSPIFFTGSIIGALLTLKEA